MEPCSGEHSPWWRRGSRKRGRREGGVRLTSQPGITATCLDRGPGGMPLLPATAGMCLSLWQGPSGPMGCWGCPTRG